MISPSSNPLPSTPSPKINSYLPSSFSFRKKAAEDPVTAVKSTALLYNIILYQVLESSWLGQPGQFVVLSGATDKKNQLKINVYYVLVLLHKT